MTPRAQTILECMMKDVGQSLSSALDDIDQKHNDDPQTNSGAKDLHEWFGVPGMDPDYDEEDE